MMDFSRSKFDIVGKAKLWYTISIIIIAIGLVGIVKNLFTEGFPLVRGIDFAGGSIIQLQFDDWDQSVDIPHFSEDIKLIVSEYTEKTPQIQTTVLSADETESGNPGLLLQIRADASLIDNTNVEQSAEMYDRIRAEGGAFSVIEETEVGAVIGRELAMKALQGVFIGLILILIYITIRLSFDFAVFAVVALFHDVLILLGVYALFSIEINSPFVAVLLTVVGYSINDTIVIYDRIRENMKVKRHLPFDRIVNQSLLETLARSINTSATTLLAILAILIFGGISLRTFMLGLGIGVLAGTYSSIFVASMLLVTWRLKGKVPVTISETAGDAASIISDDKDEDEMIGVDEDMDSDEADEPGVEPIKVDEPPAKPSKRKKPKRRRRRH